MSIAYPLETMKRRLEERALQKALKRSTKKVLTPKDVLKRERARAQREKLVAKLELQLRAANAIWVGAPESISMRIPKWEREYKFHPERGWRFDLAWPTKWNIHQDVVGGVAVEVHGGIWNQGAHVRGKRFLKDRTKLNEARLMGWTVLEVCDEHIDNGMALSWINRALDCK